MKIIKPSYEIRKLDREDILIIEEAARCCYKSEAQIKDGSAEKLIQFLIDHGHESVLEHSRITVKFIVDRGVSHELVRHRLASYSQESTRYCNYSQDKFGEEITVIEPCFFDDISDELKTQIRKVLLGDFSSFIPSDKVTQKMNQYSNWFDTCYAAEQGYFNMLRNGAKPEEARSVLPNSLKTEIFVTANFREWRHILQLRTGVKAHPQIREVMVPLLAELKTKIPVLFDDILLEEKTK